MSTPFTLGNTLRIFGKGKFYLKNAGVIERLALLDTVVFDKTGTLTDPANAKITYKGEALSEETLSILKSMVNRSTHPLSNRINYWLGNKNGLGLEYVEEIKGQGIKASYKGQSIRLGSKEFTDNFSGVNISGGNMVFLAIEGLEIGYFHIESGLRESASGVIKQLEVPYKLHVLSGDHSHEQVSLKDKLGESIQFNFNQSPTDKLNYLQKLNKSGLHTLMIGDGLNDAGALQASEVGVAVTDRVSHFSPASDAILDAESFDKIPLFLSFAKDSRNIIKASFALSFLYNIVGLTLAIQGLLSPVICAILMPLSSISVVIFTTLATNAVAWKKGLLTQKAD